MFLLDKYVFTGIVDITQNILQNYFFYDTECINNFFDDFVDCMADEYRQCYESMDQQLRTELKLSRDRRKHFTSYFVTWHLHDLLVNNLHFSKLELDMFENILPKFTGANHAKQQGYQRESY
jgi:hypothetical protein